MMGILNSPDQCQEKNRAYHLVTCGSAKARVNWQRSRSRIWVDLGWLDCFLEHEELEFVSFWTCLCLQDILALFVAKRLGLLWKLPMVGDWEWRGALANSNACCMFLQTHANSWFIWRLPSRTRGYKSPISIYMRSQTKNLGIYDKLPILLVWQTLKNKGDKILIMIWWRCCWCWWCCWWFVIHWWWSGLLIGSATPAGIASRGESGWLALGWNRRRKCRSSYIMINATHGLHTTINIWYMTLVYIYIWSIFNNQTTSYTKNCCSRWQLYPT